LAEGLKGRLREVMGIGRSERFSQNVLNSCGLRNGSDRRPGNHACSIGGGLEQHPSCPESSHHLKGDRLIDDWNLDQIPFGMFDPFADGLGNLIGLPNPLPTWPFPSPTTTRALKLNRLPPLTTLATRLI